ncbi:unnamed protein product [Amoebophrya sp. A25]|nr:unnamed protein product [Amoebophrya sp. A25]|eukprot:GSA25T00025442001.1
MTSYNSRSPSAEHETAEQQQSSSAVAEQPSGVDATSSTSVLPEAVSQDAYLRGLSTCREEIRDHGLCALPGFLKPSYVHKILVAAMKPNSIIIMTLFYLRSLTRMIRDFASIVAEKMRNAGIGFRSFERHNILLDDLPAKPPPSSAPGPPEEVVEQGLLSAEMCSSKVLINQAEIAQSEDCLGLLELYQWDGLRQLMKEAFDLPELHCSADSVGGVYLNFFEKGDRLGWHFDRSEYSMNLILRECPSSTSSSSSRDEVDKRENYKETPDISCKAGEFPPGAFVYLPDSREKVLQHTTNNTEDQNLESVMQQVKPVVPELQPGTLYLFAGNRSLHCVTENTTDTVRANCIFTFNTRAGQVLNEYTRKKFFGRDV